MCPCRSAAAIVLLLLCTQGTRLSAQVTAGGSTPEDSVRAVEMSRAQALLRADTAALSRMVADEFIEISRLGQIRTKADNIRDRVFVRRDGRWQAVAMQQTSLP